MDYLPLLLALSFVWALVRVLITSGLLRRKSSSINLPPGPKPFPIVGNILELGNKPHQALTKLSKTYGHLMTLKLGSITTIVISSPDMAKEALQKNDLAFSSRAVPDTARAFNHDKFSVAWLPASPQWRKLRKLSAMQMFLPQRIDVTEPIRRKKVQELVNHVEASCRSGQAVDIGRASFTTVLNVLSNTLFSADLAQYSSNLSLEFQDLVCGIMEELGRPNIADYFPALRFFDPQGARRRMADNFRNFFCILDSIINERRLVQSKASSGESKASSDVLDSLLSLIEEDNAGLSCDDIKHLFLDLFVAGIDTTSSTVEWAMAELLHNPEKMTKAREEIAEVIGTDVAVQESDISKFPYLQAIVKESLRLHPPGPFLVPHKAETDVEMCGFIVPKNAQILINAWAMGRDPNTWPNPTMFLPERFLEKDNMIDYKGKDFELIPFGAGRRICPGLAFANRMVPFMLASFIHYFHWKLADDMKPEDLDMNETFGLSLHKTQPLRAIPSSSI